LARTGPDGELITLEDQDRARWNGPQIEEATAILDAALREGPAGPYLIQAAIAACHATAATAADTDWAEIAWLYGRLAELTPSPVIELNRAVAVAMADGPAAGLEIVTGLEKSGDLAGYYLLPATRADLLRRLGDRPGSAASYQQALDLATTAPERRYLAARLADAEAGS